MKLLDIHFKFLLLIVLVIALTNSAMSQSDVYVCLPCGRDCDKIVLNKSGTCAHCNMELVKKSSVVFKSITPQNLCSYILTHPQAIILDVRSKKEFEGKSMPDYGTLKNAINIPINELSSRLPELVSYKNREIIVYCSHSQRSSIGSHLLTQNGFSKVFNMSGGLSELDDNSCKK